MPHSLTYMNKRIYMKPRPSTYCLKLFPVCGMTLISTMKNDVGSRYCTRTATSYPFLLINIMKLSSPLAFSKRHVQTCIQFSCCSTMRSCRMNFEEKIRVPKFSLETMKHNPMDTPVFLLPFLVLLIIDLNPLNAELNPICPLIALFGAHHILNVSR